MMNQSFITANAEHSALVYTPGVGCHRIPVIAWQILHHGVGWYVSPLFAFPVTPSMSVAVGAPYGGVTCRGVLYEGEQAFVDAIRGA